MSVPGFSGIEGNEAINDLDRKGTNVPDHDSEQYFIGIIIKYTILSALKESVGGI